jgi:hypothetical protein
MQNYSLYDDLFLDSPAMFFSTAAGPAEDDIFGPPSNVLSIYGDGSPIGRSETRIANDAVRGKGPVHSNWWQRGDVHAAIIMTLGIIGVYQYANS